MRSSWLYYPFSAGASLSGAGPPSPSLLDDNTVIILIVDDRLVAFDSFYCCFLSTWFYPCLKTDTLSLLLCFNYLEPFQGSKTVLSW